MFRLILLVLLFLLSLLTIFRAPANVLWYVSILITEFSPLFFINVALLLFTFLNGSAYKIAALIVGIASLLLFAYPVVSAFVVSAKVKNIFSKNQTSTPFRPAQMITGSGIKSIAYQTFTYDTAKSLTLDWYPSAQTGNKPCVIVIHGGSWAGGDSKQLPELNSVLAQNGYGVAAINYRLAPQYKYPAPVEDVNAALCFLCARASDFSIDTTKFFLLGRSAGAQIALSAAYTLGNPNIKGVIGFYGPADMVWGYANPTNPLVLDSRKVMEDYLGGTYSQVPQQYISSSATETAAAGAVAALLIYGGNDPLVSPLHGVRLDKKLDSLRVKHYDVYLPWATHAFDWTLNGPGGQISTWSVLQFLKTVTENK